MKILLVSEFVKPGGYYAIGSGLATYIYEADHFIKVLGKGYDAQQHWFSFSVIPSHMAWLPQHILSLIGAIKFDWVLMLMDIPRQLAVMSNFYTHAKPSEIVGVKFASLFPVESNPISSRWSNSLNKFFLKRFTFTNFGVTTCEAASIPVHKLTVGLSRFWSSPAPLVLDDQLPGKYVLTVADNQIRKNLPAAFKIMSKIDMPYVLVTNPGAVDGWDLNDLADQCGLSHSKLRVIDNRSVSDDYLKSLYDRASVFLLTSLSEGIGLPVLEAQARGLPVVASRCCGIPEAVFDQQFLIDIEYTTPYPWGNSTHYWVSVEDGRKKVEKALDAFDSGSVQIPRIPDWDIAAKELLNGLNDGGESVKA